MRKSREETARTRERIVAVAAMQFRNKGIAATGLSDLMASAGLTHGGFYKHFVSKDQLVAEASRAALAATHESLRILAAGKSAGHGLETIVNQYLSTAHRDHPAEGCTFAAIGGELARASDAARTAAGAGFMELTDLVAAQLPLLLPDEAQARAMTIVSTMVGALTLSRLAPDPDLSDQILRNARESLLRR